jgi:choloylglycine hydrolase
MLLTSALVVSWAMYGSACTDFYMNFTDPSLRFSGRTLDLGSMTNWSISTWPVESEQHHDFVNWQPKYNSLGLTGNWLGDDHFLGISFFGDSLNEHGLSCSFLTLVDTEYEEKSESKNNIFAGTFCHWASQLFTSVDEVQEALQDVAIWGPNALAQHFALRDASGKSLVVECTGGQHVAYLDANDGVETFGIMTNEPTFDYHLMNIRHYEWKRSLARQAVAVPGNFYPEERYLRVHMVKSGMQELMESTRDYQTAFSLTAQVLNTVTVPMGEQYGTDSGETSGEGNNDHSQWGLVRDHSNAVIYWRDAANPTFRRVSLKEALASSGGVQKTMKLQTGPYYVDMTAELA